LGIPATGKWFLHLKEFAMRFLTYVLQIVGLMFASFLTGQYYSAQNQQTACLWGIIAILGFLSLLVDYRRAGPLKAKQPGVVV